ncbi:MAG: hypothetical protein AABW49_04595 [Nanoarchaeota archaeon]
MFYEKKGSRVIGTVLFIAFAVISAASIFLWATGLVGSKGEAVSRELESMRICPDVRLGYECADDSVIVSNNGLHSIDKLLVQTGVLTTHIDCNFEAINCGPIIGRGGTIVDGALEVSNNMFASYDLLFDLGLDGEFSFDVYVDDTEASHKIFLIKFLDKNIELSVGNGKLNLEPGSLSSSEVKKEVWQNVRVVWDDFGTQSGKITLFVDGASVDALVTDFIGMTNPVVVLGDRNYAGVTMFDNLKIVGADGGGYSSRFFDKELIPGSSDIPIPLVGEFQRITPVVTIESKDFPCSIKRITANC